MKNICPGRDCTVTFVMNNALTGLSYGGIFMRNTVLPVNTLPFMLKVFVYFFAHTGKRIVNGLCARAEFFRGFTV